MRRTRLLGFAAAVLTILPSSPVAAATSSAAAAPVAISQQTGVEVRGDFQVGPTRFVLEMNPGEEQTIEVQLTSREGEPRSFTLSVEDFSVSDDGQDNIQFYGNGSGPFSAKSWVTPIVTNISLRHSERATIPVRVVIPKNAAVGDHYSVVLFQRDPKNPGSPGLNMIARVGALFLITVKGDMVRQAALQQFLVAKPVFWSLPASFSMQYRNTGTVHVTPRGHIEIRNILGAVVDDIQVKDWYVLRNSTRRREILWKPTFALGYYTATLSIAAFDGDEEVKQTVSFWVIPGFEVTMSLLAIFGVSFLVQAFFSRFELRRKKR